MTDRDDVTHSKKRKTKTNETTKSKNPKTSDDVQKNTHLPGSASDKVVDVEIKDRLLVHPVARWFQEVIK